MTTCKIFAPIILAFVLLSCYVTQRTPIKAVLDPWLGKTENELLMHFGPPTLKTDDGQKGKILSYEEMRAFTIVLPMYNWEVEKTRVDKLFMQYYVNAEGIIYHWRSNYPDIVKRIRKSKDGWDIKKRT